MECLLKTANLDYVQTLSQRVECVLNLKFVVYIGHLDCIQSFCVMIVVITEKCDVRGDCSNGFKCRVDPECRMNGGTRVECRTNGEKVCMAVGGRCKDDTECDVDADFKCLDRNPNEKLCIKYQE